MVRYRLLVFVFIILLAGCCGDKYCGEDEVATIAIQYRGYTDAELRGRIILTVDKSTGQLVDSVNFLSSPDTLILLRSYKEDMKQVNFILENTGRTDTISAVDYTLASQKVTCNNCFPTGHTTDTKSYVQNFSFLYRGAIYNGADTLVVSK